MDWIGNAPHGVRLPYNYLSLEKWQDIFVEANLEVEVFSKNIPLYPAPFSYVFGRGLHFIAVMRPH